MKTFLGILIILAGIALAVWLGLYVCLYGGALTLWNMIVGNVAWAFGATFWAIVKIVFGGTVTGLCFYSGIYGGLAVINS